MMKSYETPKEEVLAGLTETLGKISDYRAYLVKSGQRSGTKVRHEDEKILAIRRAIAFIQRCPASPTGGEP